jgi:tRNA pseudouridine38-40 synthase
MSYSSTEKPYSRNCEIIDKEQFPVDLYRVALAIEYNGCDFHGFQKQPNGVVTVQECLEKALSKVANESIALVCAGRTDAGVHATYQVIHFDTHSERPLKAWTKGVNAFLPDSVSVNWAANVSPLFHARFSAQSRTYRYLICRSPTRPALGADYFTWERRSIDVSIMREATKALVGNHDFTSFRTVHCQAKNPVRHVKYIEVIEQGDLLCVEINANAFLHHMVRNIVGALLEVACGKRKVEWVAQVLAAKDRTKAGVMAKPDGLHLVAVDYPKHFELPIASPSPRYFPVPLYAVSE